MVPCDGGTLISVKIHNMNSNQNVSTRSFRRTDMPAPRSKPLVDPLGRELSKKKK